MTIHGIEKTSDLALRCHGAGPCENKKLDGVNYCAKCGGGKALADKEKRSLSAYRLAKFQDRVSRFSDHSGIKGLRDEIGILRMVMEERLNQINTPLELLTHTHTISDLAVKIEKLVTSCHKLEKSMDTFLDANQVMQLGLEIVQIITTHVDDPKAIENISNDLAKTLERIFKDES